MTSAAAAPLEPDDDIEPLVYEAPFEAPHSYQLEIVQHPATHKVFAAGRGSGKSRTGEMWIAEGLARAYDQEIIVLAQTYGAVKRRYWRPLQTLLGPAIRYISKTDLRLELWNGSWVQLFGADNPGSLRGVHPHRTLIDEEDELYEDLFPEVIEPMLQAKRGESMHLGTPKGRKVLWRHFRQGQDEVSGWKSWTMKSIDAPHLDPARVERARATMDAFLFRQEYEAAFELRSGLVFGMFNPTLHVKKARFDPALPVYGGEDFNIGFQYTCFWQEVPRPRKRRPLIRVLAEVVSRDVPTYEHAKRMRAHLATDPWKLQPPHVTLYPDASGNARQRSGDSDFYMLREQGFEVVAPAANPSVEDRDNAVRAMLRAADGTVSIEIDPSCRVLIEAFEKFAFVPKTNPPQRDKRSGYDHPCDAIGYGVHYRHPLRAPSGALYG